MSDTTQAAAPETDGSAPTEVGIPEALAMAVNCHRAGRLVDAETLYGRILAVAPDQPDALGFLGVIRLGQGRLDEAIALVSRAIEIDPTSAGRHNNLGNLYLADDRIDDAVASYERSLALEPNQADANSNLGIIYRARGRFEDAARAFERAIAAAPDQTEPWNNYGNMHMGLGRARDAILCYSRALTLRPHDPEARRLIGLAHAQLGEFDKAAGLYREWLADEPDNPTPKHLLAACSGEGIPERATDAYIVRTFDNFAKSFDSQLAKLDYRAPQLVADALARSGAAAAGRLAIADIGCGTGLCGPLVAPYAQHLTGVDLSPGMLGKARTRAVYDELVEAELTQFLRSHGAAFDAIVCADTLVYFGALEEALAAAAQALRDDGVFVFTVEAADDAAAPAGYRINHHGRYAHTRAYVERVAAAAGFGEIAIATGVLRQEAAEDVAGLVVTARKPERSASWR